MAARRTAIVTAWVLAAAAVLVAAVSWRNWEQSRHLQGTNQKSAAPNTLAAGNGQYPASGNASAGVLSADDSGEFTPLPGTTLDETEEASIFHVRMQRGSLGALGLPVNEESAGEWIQVDLLVGNDGLPQAVRLAEEEN